MFKFVYAAWKAFWGPDRRQAQTRAGPQRQAALEGPYQAELTAREEGAAKDEQEAEKYRLHAYQAHLEAVDLNEIATRDGTPMNPSEIFEEVRKRMRLSLDAKRDPNISLADNMSEDEIAVVSSQLDRTALNWLLKHSDPDGQRIAAKTILGARADFDEVMPLDLYVTIVAEAVARSAAKLRVNRIAMVVIVRAILLRALDPRWTRLRRNELRPLSKAHW